MFSPPDDRSLEDPLPDSPLPLLDGWLEEARKGEVQPNPDALTLATLDPDGRLSARVVLARGYDAEAGYLVFYTNRHSRKGHALAHHGRAAGVLHWDVLGRQVRVEGPVVESPGPESDAYWAGRMRSAQIAASVSDQSRPIGSRRELVEALEAELARRGGADGPAVPRPAHWGGYRLWIERCELWVAAAGRAHDRGLWTRRLVADGEGGFHPGSWEVRRLQP